MGGPRCAPLLLLLLLSPLLTPPAGDAAVITGVSCPRTCRAWSPRDTRPGVCRHRVGCARCDILPDFPLATWERMSCSQGREQPGALRNQTALAAPSSPLPPAPWVWSAVLFSSAKKFLPTPTPTVRKFFSRGWKSSTPKSDRLSLNCKRARHAPQIPQLPGGPYPVKYLGSRPCVSFGKQLWALLLDCWAAALLFLSHSLFFTPSSSWSSF